jgi:hypothetical protein
MSRPQRSIHGVSEARVKGESTVLEEMMGVIDL